MAESTKLSSEQSTTLFDILTHWKTYDEIEQFKNPEAIKRYGPPFQDKVDSTNSPILQTLLSKFVLTLPGMRDVSPRFWKTQVEDLIQELSEAQLSESYDKGVLGIRKTLATAISALIEYPTRGCLGGFPKIDIPDSRQYDKSNPEDVLQAFQDFLQKMVYGDLIDKLFAKAAETGDLSQHDSLVQAAHEFIVVNLASFMHYIFVLSPEGPSLLRMISGVHQLAPYTVIRQTLKIGNVATMLSGMMRVVLAKVSLSSVTNWIGLSSGADEGMNLLQQIMSQVLGWDKRELRKRAEKIEKDKKGPSKEVRDELKDWITRSRGEHEECRNRSKEQSMSIVSVILALSSVSQEMSEEQHTMALEYLALQLSIRDRQEIIRILCKRNPDHLTQAIRDGVDAYTPMIRHVHQAVNLSDTVWDFEVFLNDMIKISKPKSSDAKPPSVEDFVDLLRKHQGMSHKFLHQVAKNGKEVTKWWQDYVHEAAAQFRGDATSSDASVLSKKVNGAEIQKSLSEAFAALSESDQSVVKKEIEAHAKYLRDLHSASAARISAVINRSQSSTPYGPGAYLARWQTLLDSTAITPATAKGAVRHGGSRSVKEEGRKDVDGHVEGFMDEEQAEKAVGDQTPGAPDVQKTVELLGPKFKAALGS